MTSRDWCITDHECNIIDRFANVNKDNIKYFVAQHEICPETNNVHIQGFIILKTPQRMSFIKNLFNNNGLHLEKRRGTPQQVMT